MQAKAQVINTKSLQGWFTSSYWSPVYCNGELVDILNGGVLRVHWVLHFKDGADLWETDQLKGEVTSTSGEVFQVKEVDKYYYSDTWYVRWHYNLMGNRGNHYVGFITINYFTGEIVEIANTHCN